MKIRRRVEIRTDRGNEADYVLQCGATNKDDSGKYAVLLLLDYIVMSYMKRYD